MRYLLLIPSALCLAFITACSSAEETTEPTTVDFEPRDPEAPILGAVSEEGHCDPEVIDIDHERNTPYVTYHGQPGDAITLQFVANDGVTVLEESDFELSSRQTGHHALSGLYNGDISGIHVTANGRVGQAGTCVIPVA
ncbi:hypothetical protein [Corynebacterium lowii]|uniref:Uncharacterized protein n=1 Tax=Corynebacterium lowii TaxID=1544413 RepID=A0A0Q0U559_9CORY|nr:hypothetical protein [Corynebacterium lowii]KQB87088.1 hypothetical protein Clow_00136 [Corynebacterium lowii]MDP9852328.1 hypothetical protein [Corynebacterium lowii]